MDDQKHLVQADTIRVAKPPQKMKRGRPQGLPRIHVITSIRENVVSLIYHAPASPLMLLSGERGSLFRVVFVIGQVAAECGAGYFTKLT